MAEGPRDFRGGHRLKAFHRLERPLYLPAYGNMRVLSSTLILRLCTESSWGEERPDLRPPALPAGFFVQRTSPPTPRPFSFSLRSLA